MKYDFRCFLTEVANVNLTCHHLYSWNICPEGRYEINNGVAMTKEIHDEFHNLYGRGNNSPAQFERFLFEKYNITEYPWRNENHELNNTIEDVLFWQETREEQSRTELLDII